MTFPVIVRRTHLYLGAIFLPWFVMFSLSSFVFNHPMLFGGGEGGGASVEWKAIMERPYDLAVAPDADLRAVGARIIMDAGLSADAGFGVGRPNPNRINVNLPSFAHPIRVSYFINEHRVLAERRAFAWGPALTNMHTRDGYYLHSPRQTVWAVLVDAVCVALVLWVLSGLYMWWKLPATRGWGWLAIAAGAGSFAGLMLTL